VSKSYFQWSMDRCALIDSLEEAGGIAKRSVTVLTSGGFDPIHPGHISYLQQSIWKAKKFHRDVHGCSIDPTLIVLVNSDAFLEKKKGRAFMPIMARCQIVSAVLPYKDYGCVVVPFVPTDPEDMTVCEAIQAIKPNYFCKGGDRDLSNIPEVDVCNKVGTTIITGCGDEKYWSSSDFIKEHNEFLYTQMGL